MKQSGETSAADDSDAALVERLTRGDRDALAVLYQRHGALLLALGYRLLRDKAEAEDLVHDVFVEAWEHCEQYVATRSTVVVWLLLRMRSRALDRLRSRKRRQAAMARGSQADASHPVIERELTDRHRIPAALARIPATQQDVIVLSYYEGLSILEISTRLGVPAGTVKSRAHAALASLRIVLGVNHG